MSDLIQQLKDNEKPFGLMSEDMQEKAREIGKGFFGWWVAGAWTDCPVKQFRSEATYRLCPDYTEEQGIVECEIRYNDSVGRFYFDGLNMCPLSQVFNRRDFIGFKFEGWIWGRAYKHKRTGLVAIMIPAEHLDDYDVVDMTQAKVLFRRQK